MSMFSSALRGFATGGISGALAGAIPKSLSRGGGGGSIPSPFGGGLNPGVSIGGPYGINIGFGQFGKGAQPTPTGATGCPRGYHLNKHALAASKRHGALAARSICVRNRSMNPMNHRALSRALKREKRAAKIIRRLRVFRPVHHQTKGRKR